MKIIIASFVALAFSVPTVARGCIYSPEFDLRDYLSMDLIEVQAFRPPTQEGAPEGWRHVDVFVRQVLLSDASLPEQSTTQATLSYQHRESDDTRLFERGSRYFVGVWTNGSEDNPYTGTLTVMADSCRGRRIFSPSGRIGVALQMLLDGEGDQETELAILNEYIRRVQW